MGDYFGKGTFYFFSANPAFSAVKSVIVGNKIGKSICFQGFSKAT